MSGVEGFAGRVERGTSPEGYGGRPQSALARLRNSAASGHVVANAMRMRVAVSLMRAASFSSRSRMVANSALANGCGLGMVARMVARCDWRGGGE